jgi:hypothetical protein
VAYEVVEMILLLLIWVVDEYSMDGSCKNKVKFGYFGVAEELKDLDGSWDVGVIVYAGRVSKRFRGRKQRFLSEAMTLGVEIELNPEVNAQLLLWFTHRIWCKWEIIWEEYWMGVLEGRIYFVQMLIDFKVWDKAFKYNYQG